MIYIYTSAIAIIILCVYGFIGSCINDFANPRFKYVYYLREMGGGRFIFYRRWRWYPIRKEIKNVSSLHVTVSDFEDIILLDLILMSKNKVKKSYRVRIEK